MLRVSAVFHHCGFLQMISLLCLLLLVLSGQTPLVVVEDSKLEKIELGTTIHTPFTEVSLFCSVELDERSSDAASIHLS